MKKLLLASILSAGLIFFLPINNAVASGEGHDGQGHEQGDYDDREEIKESQKTRRDKKKLSREKNRRSAKNKRKQQRDKRRGRDSNPNPNIDDGDIQDRDIMRMIPNF